MSELNGTPDPPPPPPPPDPPEPPEPVERPEELEPAQPPADADVAEGRDLIDNLDPTEADTGPEPSDTEHTEPEPADPDITETDPSEPEAEPDPVDQHESTGQAHPEPANAEPTGEPTQPTETTPPAEDEPQPGTARNRDLVDNLDPPDVDPGPNDEHDDTTPEAVEAETTDRVPPYGQNVDKTTGVPEFGDGREPAPQDSGQHGSAGDLLDVSSAPAAEPDLAHATAADAAAPADVDPGTLDRTAGEQGPLVDVADPLSEIDGPGTLPPDDRGEQDVDAPREGPAGEILYGSHPELAQRLDQERKGEMTGYEANLAADPSKVRHVDQDGPQYDYQRSHCGEVEFRISPDGDLPKAAWADGLNGDLGLAQDAKFVRTQAQSWYVPDSLPPTMAGLAERRMDDRLSKYGEAVADPSNPIRGLEIITNNRAAAEFIAGRMAALRVPGIVRLSQ